MLKSIEEVGAPAAPVVAPKIKAAQVSMDLPEGGWGYCTGFLIEGQNLDVERIRTQMEAMGNSVLVVGEPELVKVHVHTDDPTKVIGVAGRHGKLLKLSVGDMSTQHRRILEQETGGPAAPLRENGVGIVAVVAGRGPGGHFQGPRAGAPLGGGPKPQPRTP